MSPTPIRLHRTRYSEMKTTIPKRIANRRAVARLLLSFTLAGCISVPTVNATQAQLQPIPAGFARVWFLRQFEPAESLATPMIYVNGAPVAPSQPGAAFFRDLVPGSYTFTVDSYGVDTNQAATLQLVPGMQPYLEIQSLRSWDRFGDSSGRDTFYVRTISAEWAAKYLPTMSYLGPR
jgi:hypothetical protein